MPESKISFAKIAANPNPTTWSQAYSAGKLFAVLSLEKIQEENNEQIQENDFLTILGKNILNTLENEFFALETKDLESIKNAILITAHKIPDNIAHSFVVCTLIKDVLYIFIIGEGKIYLKRGKNFGVVLQSSQDTFALDEQKSIKAASGYVQENDIIVLATKRFCEIIPSEKLATILDNLSPEEIVEQIAPDVHGHQQGGAAAIFIKFNSHLKSEEENGYENATSQQEVSQENEENNDEKPEESLEENIPERVLVKKETVFNVGLLIKNILRKLSFLKNRKKINKPSFLTPSKKRYLFVVIIVLFVFTISIFLAIKKQNEEKINSLFNNVYTSASKNYEEGQSYLDLNQNLARESFVTSKKLLMKTY
jgi:hypothetical protein